MNKPRAFWDWAYWIITALFGLFFFAETFVCSTESIMADILCPSDWGVQLIMVYIFLIPLGGFWCILTFVMFIRAFRIKQQFGLSRYLYAYVLPLLAAIAFGTYFLYPLLPSKSEPSPEAVAIKNLILDGTTPPKANDSNYSPVEMLDYSYKYRNDLFYFLYPLSNNTTDYSLYYKGGKATFLSFALRDESLESVSNMYFQGGMARESTIDGHKALTKVLVNPYEGIIASIVTIIEIRNGKILLLFAYPHQESDIQYYNEIIESLKFK